MAMNGMGAAYDRLGRHDLAVRWYARALALEPGSAATLNNIGYSYLMQDRPDLAVAFLRDAQARDGADPVIRANRRAAEEALAAAGGPRPRHPAALAPLALPASPAPRPRIERVGASVHALITRPGPSERTRLGIGQAIPDDRPAPRRGAGDAYPWLPDYVASPMAREGAGRAPVSEARRGREVGS